jgi:hypothetical protein
VDSSLVSAPRDSVVFRGINSVAHIDRRRTLLPPLGLTPLETGIDCVMHL